MANNFQHMAGAGGNNMNPMMMQQHQQQQQQQQQNQGSQNQAANALQHMLLNNIQSQTGHLTGWQASVIISERFTQVWHIVSQLRLVNGGQHDLQKICGMALQFEKNSFEQSPDKETYTKALQDKLAQLTAVRAHVGNNVQQQMQAQAQSNQQAQAQAQVQAARQAQAQAMGMGNPTGMQGQMGRSIMGQQAPQQQQSQQQTLLHLQHQMQASPLPNQQQPPSQQMPMGMVNNGLPQNMNQPQQQQFQMAMAQQQLQQQQAQQQQQQQQQHMPQNRQQPQLTAQEQAIIGELTSRMMAAASEEEKNTVRQNMRTKLDQTAMLNYQNRGVDIASLYYRNQAILRMRQQKQHQAQQHANQQQPPNIQGNINTGPSAQSMQQQRSGNPNPMNIQGQQQPGQMGGNSGDFGSFLGSVENLIGQQQQGVLAQEAGQMVVPVSVPQGSSTPQPQAFAVQQGGTNGQRPGPNPNLRAQQQQQMFNAQQAQQERMHAAQSQAQLRTSAQAKAQQQMALHGQPGVMSSMPSQQSPAMNTLNTPLRTTQQQVNHVDPQQMTQPNQPITAQFGQAIDPRFVPMNQQQRTNAGAHMNGVALNGPMFPPNMPQEQRQKLLTLPKDKLNEVISKWTAQQQQGQATKPQVQIPANAQGIQRPNQPGQPSPFNQQALAAQFMPGVQNGQPPPQMMANMSQQQQILLRQQMAGMRGAQQARGPNMSQNMNVDPQAISNMLDPHEFPRSMLSQSEIFRQVPPEVVKWRELKQWAMGTQPPMQGPILEQIKHFQRLHYTTILRNRTAQAAQQLQRQQAGAGPINGQQINQQPPASMVPSGMAPVAQMGQQPPQMQNQILINISQSDIQKARAHPSGKWAGLSDGEITAMIRKNAEQQQQRRNNQNQQQMQMAQMAQMSGMQQQTPQQAQRSNAPPQPQMQQTPKQPPKQPGRPQPSQTAAHAQTSAEPTAATAATGRAAKTAQAARAAQTSSPAQPPKNLKRASSSDDVVEVPNPNVSQPPRSVPQQGAVQQRPQGNRVPFTPQQIASMSPEQRKAYEAALARQQASNMARATPADIHKCTQAMQEERARAEPLAPITMKPEDRATMATKLVNTGSKLRKVRQALPRWFAISHDETKLRTFCKTYYRISQQFVDDDMEKPNDVFSIQPIDVDQAYMLANRMMSDVANLFPKLAMTKSNSGTAPSSTAPAVPKDVPQTSPPVPLNAANLHQQQQALKQQQAKVHNRQASRGGPPAAPTSAQPPFPIGSPMQTITDQFPKNPLTQDQLRLPPTKKQRQSNNSTPIVGQQTSTSATPVIKAGSPGKLTHASQLKQAEKMIIRCPEVHCEGHYGEGFETVEALEKHRHEEHVIPLENPQQFVLGELANILGLDESGAPKKDPTTEVTSASNMAPNLSQPGQAGLIKTGGTPAATPLNRQASATGIKASPAASKASKSAKADEAKIIKQTEVMAPIEMENLWDHASVNPQDLQTNFKHLETGAGGAISDMSVWRALTPNDTPESSKDGVSEPNSDITEGLDLAINLDLDFSGDWQPFGPGDDLLDFGKMDVNSDLTDILMGDEQNNPTNFASWNEFIDFDKPLVHDTSLYSLNVE